MKNKGKYILIGMLIAILAPLISSFIISSFKNINLANGSLPNLAKLYSLASIVNLGLFYIFLKKYYAISKGILISTIFILIITSILKFFY